MATTTAIKAKIITVVRTANPAVFEPSSLGLPVEVLSFFVVASGLLLLNCVVVCVVTGIVTTVGFRVDLVLFGGGVDVVVVGGVVVVDDGVEDVGGVVVFVDVGGGKVGGGSVGGGVLDVGVWVVGVVDGGAIVLSFSVIECVMLIPGVTVVDADAIVVTFSELPIFGLSFVVISGGIICTGSLLADNCVVGAFIVELISLLPSVITSAFVVMLASSVSFILFGSKLAAIVWFVVDVVVGKLVLIVVV